MADPVTVGELRELLSRLAGWPDDTPIYVETPQDAYPVVEAENSTIESDEYTGDILLLTVGD